MICHNYIFLTSGARLSDLDKTRRKLYEDKFIEMLTGSKRVTSYTFTTLGLKGNTKIMIWFQADKIESIQELLNKLMHSNLGKYLKITHTLFAMSRPTQYSPKSTGHTKTERKGGRYLIIYPFTKTKEWYRIDFEKRRNLMGGHVMVGKKYHTKIDQLLLYSYGIDDSEFLVSYETDDLSAFQSLVMDLRTDPVRQYTLKDTPIFTCIYKTPDKVLKFL